MDMTVIAVGKLKERYWSQACDEYLKRLGRYARVQVREVPDVDPARAGGEGAAREQEARSVLSLLPERAHLIACAIEGTPRSSVGLADRLQQLALDGRSDVCFALGGSTGLAPSVLERADETLSFGPITLPHNLARVVLLEQLYRAWRIARNEPYHK